MNDRVLVRMFAGARERVGSDFVEIKLNLPASVFQLKEAIAMQFEPLRPLVEYGRIAVDNEFVDDKVMIDDMHDERVFALIPPVSGG